MKRLFFNLLLIFLSGCAHKPSDLKKQQQDLQATQWCDHQKWWLAFGDPVLNQLADQILKKNLEIQIALARLREAYALKDVAEGEFFPDISGQMSASRENLVSPYLINYTQAGLKANWELDFFGKIRSSVDKAEADELAKKAGVEDARLILIADLAQAVIQWRQAENMLKLLKKLIHVQDSQIKVLSTRVKSGLIEASSLENARALREQTKAKVYPAKALANAACYRIEKLMNCHNRSIRNLLKANDFLVIKIPQNNLLKTISVQTLANRPDIKMAQADLLGVNAELRQAEAGLWPQISLSAFFGVQNPSGTFFLASNPIWSIGSSLVCPILNFGRLRGLVDASDARLQQALLQYENTVNGALQETRTALSDYLNGLNAIDNQRKALQNHESMVQLARIRFAQGLTDKTDLTQAQVLFYQAKLDLISLRSDTALSYVRLQKALGLPSSPV